jgi:hypothetical protein
MPDSTSSTDAGGAPPPREPGGGLPSLSRRGAAGSAALLLSLLSLASLLALAFRHSLFYDESVRIHVTWLVAEGLRPFRDFFFESPVLSHIVLSPLLSLLPEGGYLVVLLRLVMVALAAATAAILWRHGKAKAGGGIFGAAPFLLVAASPEMGRFLVEFSPDHPGMVAAAGTLLVALSGTPSPRRIGAAAALSVLAVSLNPKYGYPLAPAGAAFLLSGLLEGGSFKRLVPAGLLGVAAGLLLHGALLLLAGIAPLDTLTWGYLFPAAYHAEVVGRNNDATLAWQLLLYFEDNPATGLFLALGAAGWAATLFRRPLREALPAGGLLAGTVAFSLTTLSRHEQYLLPALLSLCFLAPYGAALFGRGSGGSAPEEGGRRSRLHAAWGLGACAFALLLLLDSAGISRRTLSTEYYRDEVTLYRQADIVPETILETATRIDWLLSVIPRGERVVALWSHHPLFRHDVSRVFCDETPSFAVLLPPDDPTREWFAPASFGRELAARPPAYIGWYQLLANLPPGWYGELERYALAHRGSYLEVPTRYGGSLFRSDLILSPRAAIAPPPP